MGNTLASAERWLRRQLDTLDVEAAAGITEALARDYRRPKPKREPAPVVTPPEPVALEEVALPVSRKRRRIATEAVDEPAEVPAEE
jgi:hypothetical protein